MYEKLGQVRPCIMSGGAGTRLWPLSRRSKPKQFIPISGDQSLFSQTLSRVAPGHGFKAPRVIGSAEHRFLIAEELAEAGIVPDQIILEPFGRNTAAATVLAAISGEKDELVLVLPSDHSVGDETAFREAVMRAVPAALDGYICCFGIKPDYAETGYGYIESGEEGAHPGVFQVARFSEKPDAKTAENYVKSGRFTWNSGMFLMRADTLIDECNSHVPGLVDAVCEAYAKGVADMDFHRLNAEAFERVEDISIDYAVMEPTRRAAVVPASMGWTDLGSYSSLHSARMRDDDGNSNVGDVLIMDCRNTLVQSNGPLIAAKGLDDMIIVADDDVVMVTPMSLDQDVGSIVKSLSQKGRKEASQHATVYRPWGSYKSLALGQEYQVKEIVVYPGKRLSLQLHHKRAEHWVVVEGKALVTRGDEQMILSKNQSIYIPAETKHRLENTGTHNLHLIEVQSGHYLGEDDIVRFDDDFGRLET